MSRHTVIEVQHLSKEYRLGIINHGTLRRDLQSWWARVRGRPDPNTVIREDIWDDDSNTVTAAGTEDKLDGADHQERFLALDDVSFEVEEGETFGIIGKNGAGKSTLLKILCRITAPTAGHARIRGRIASLLEVGTGFHPELTGRENVFLNGAILGMTRAEIRHKFDAIVEFSQLARFIDTPVKRYSSGMYVRLAFSVAAHLDAEVLIVDEVLAVGDYEFQRKCLDKLRDVTALGRTVLLVSHNMSAVQNLCSRAIHLRRGRLVGIGDASRIVQSYLIPQRRSTAKVRDVDMGQAKFMDWWLTASTASTPHACFTRETCKAYFRIQSKITLADAYIGIALWSADGVLIFGASSWDAAGPLRIEPGLFDLEMTLRVPIKDGVYQLELSLNSHNHGQLDRWISDRMLTVLPTEQSTLHEKWRGILNEEATFRLSRVEKVESSTA